LPFYAAASAASCSSSSNPVTTVGSDAAAESGAGGGVDASDGAVDAGNADAAPFACAPGDLSDVPEVTPTSAGGNAPSPAGGTLAPGRYVLNSVTVYGNDASAPDAAWLPSLRHTIEIAQGIERNTFVTNLDGGFYFVGTLSVSGTSEDVTYQCATDPDPVTHHYTQRTQFSATPTTITTFEAPPGLVLASEFTRKGP
jgi:hypothetical protein